MAAVLLIDDAVSSLAWMTAALVEANHQTIECTSARQALEVLASAPVELIVTDIYMPEQDGLGLIMSVRRKHPDIPIIAISGMTGRWSMLDAAHLLGAVETLSKPISQETLRSAVDRALNSRKTA